MLLKSPAKINLTLKVNKKLKNGLHNIQSYYCLINLYDEIKIRTIKEKNDKIKFVGSFKHNINQDNTVSNTIKLLRDKGIVTNRFKVKVNKKIPVFAGLGGGTSNAVCLAKLLAKSKINIIKKFIKKEIGSDTVLFFNNQGFLKNLNTVIKLKPFSLFFLLVHPGIKCSTKKIFSKKKYYSKTKSEVFKKFNNKETFLKYISKEKNELQSIVENQHPVIKRLLKKIQDQKGCCFSRMTGSGSVCYGVFKSKKAAKVALNRIRLMFPKYWTCVAKTI